MTRQLTNSLLSRAFKAAVKARELNAELTEAFNARYGCTYSDVSCDGLIDALDYGTARSYPTIDVCDMLMAACDRPALSSQSRNTEAG